MLEAEISPTGDVLVEGHHVGELQGFRFTADQTADGEDGKAVRGAAQKALAQEFETRAERFAAAGNGDFALGSDGVLRWIGTPVATLASTEDALKPRVILLADEQLTGPARDKVAARADRFVAYQIETLLKPLIDLKSAEQLTGIARGIAFRLVESFGLVNRRDIAEDVRSLDQEARAALRRLGVRFGAYHIFVPALVKPGPAGLITLLWALGHDGKDKPGFGDVVHALASGRTSVVVDPTFESEFYRLAGYRMLGRRAVRVDILERLADLIRPASSWKDGAGARPDGAYGGSAFIVTPPMMSILGATAEDMEEILKGLGYRAEPKQAAHVEARLAGFDAVVREKAAADAAAKAEQAEIESQAAAGLGQAASDEGSEPETAVEAGIEAAAPTASTEMVDEVAPDAAPAEISEAPSGQQEASADTDTAVETAKDAQPTPDTATSEAQPAETGEPATVEVAEERPPVLVWRQARADGRPQHRGRPGQRNDQRQGARPDGAANADAKGEREGGSQRFERKFRGRKPAGGDAGQGGAGQGAEREQRPRPAGERHGRDRDQNRNKDRRNEKPGGERDQKQHKPREERPARIDPDSPFAKLAALRDQLRK